MIKVNNKYTTACIIIMQLFYTIIIKITIAKKRCKTSWGNELYHVHEGVSQMYMLCFQRAVLYKIIFCKNINFETEMS